MTDTRNINQPDQSKQTDSEKKTPEQREQGQTGQFEKGQQGQSDKDRQSEQGWQPEQSSEKSAIGGGTSKSEELNKEKSPSSPTDR